MECHLKKVEGTIIRAVIPIIIWIILGAISYADEYVLVMSKDNGICHHMLRLINKDLKKYDQIIFKDHEEFSAIKWEIKTFDDNGHYSANSQKILLSVFDINNDAKAEIVLKTFERGVKGVPADNVFVFKKEDAGLFRNGISAKDLRKASAILGGAFDRKPFESNIYELKEIPPYDIMPIFGKEKDVPFNYSLGGWFYFNPFYYRDAFFLTMTERDHSSVQKWLVIMKMIPDNSLKDICYFLRAVECNKNIMR